MVELERDCGIQREQKLVLPAIKRPKCHANAIGSVITNVWPYIHLLHGFPVDSQSFGGLPVHAESHCVIIRRRTYKGDVACVTDALVIGCG